MTGGTGHGGWRQGWRRARLASSGGLQVDGEVLDGGELEVCVEPRAMPAIVGRPWRA